MEKVVRDRVSAITAEDLVTSLVIALVRDALLVLPSSWSATTAERWATSFVTALTRLCAAIAVSLVISPALAPMLLSAATAVRVAILLASALKSLFAVSATSLVTLPATALIKKWRGLI